MRGRRGTGRQADGGGDGDGQRAGRNTGGRQDAAPCGRDANARCFGEREGLD